MIKIMLMALFLMGCVAQTSQGACCAMMDSTQKGMMEKPMMHDEQCKPSWNGQACYMCPMSGCKIYHHRHVCAKLLVLLLLFCAVVNILLTILVILDMTKSGRFNGLWIPLTILIGIPGTALYALFRIGDSVKEKNGK